MGCRTPRKITEVVQEFCKEVADGVGGEEGEEQVEAPLPTLMTLGTSKTLTWLPELMVENSWP
jgi:hypothetical protein